MTPPSLQQTKLLNLLRELFQLDQPDLDFGLYRIMHAKSREIEHFLEHDLLDTIRQKVGGNKADKVAQAKSEYERKKQTVIEDGGDPDASRQVQQALAEYKATQESQDEDTQLYDHLHRFLERYYEGGDFLSRRYYARETSEKAAPYAVPYDGSEVYLHWANKDQYYIKTTESFRQFSVDLALAQAGDKQLFDDAAPRKVHFTLVEAEEGSHNNVKATSDKDRYFILDAETPLEWQGNELTVRFHYCADPEKSGQAGKWRATRNERNEQGILNALGQQAQGDGDIARLAQSFHQPLATPIPKGKSGDTQTLLAKYLNQYTAKNSMDYFIHKNLGSFLKRELDFYIKNELFRLDDLGNADALNSQQLDKLLKNALTLREVAHKLIEFLAQTEDFQKKLWLKKKFVVDTQWLVTLDKVPASLYPQIEANEAQWAEWVKLGFVATDAKRYELLKPDSFLVVDTQLFDAAFTASLLASIGNLDEATDGVLVHSENFQALNLLTTRYSSSIDCIAIDPPYNTGSDGFTYKDSYKSSSWLSQQAQLTPIAQLLLTEIGSLFSFCDENQVHTFGAMLFETFGQHNLVETIVWNKRIPKNDKGIGNIHDYIYLFSNNLASRKLAEKSYVMKKDELDDIYEVVNKCRVVKATLLEAQKELKKFYKKQGYDRGITLYCELDQNYEIWGKINMSWPNAKTEGPRYEVISPVTKLPVPIPKNGWRWKEETFRLAEKNGPKYSLPDGSMVVGRVWYSAKSTVQPSSITYLKEVQTFLLRSIISNKSDGSLALENLGLSGLLDYPKSVSLLERLIYAVSEPSGIYLDYFAGSGTTGHAIINLNREDNGKRKYILVEMGDYFDTVMKARIQKVVYSADWKDGKPASPETGISQLVKVIRLESYEDTLNNLQVAEESAQRKVIEANPALRESYFLHYLLAMETQGSPSLLNVSAFADPTAYTLSIKKPGSDAQERRAVDLVETFNWLIGLRVTQLHAPQTFAASFTQEVDLDLPNDAQKRLVLKGKLKAAADGAWWFRAIQGIVKGAGASAREERTLVVWRKLTGDLEQDNIVLEAYLRKELKFDVRQNQDGALFDVIYVNGSHALPVMPQCEVRQLEETFHRLMWDVQDV